MSSHHRWKFEWFQSTPHAGATRHLGSAVLFVGSFNPRPTQGRQRHTFFVVVFFRFNPRPTQGRQENNVAEYTDMEVSIHAPRRGDHRRKPRRMGKRCFNPRPTQGRPLDNALVLVYNGFNLRPTQGRQVAPGGGIVRQTFQSTPHAGATQI